MGYKRPSLVPTLVALGAVLYQVSGAVGSHKPTGEQGLVQGQEVPQSSENEQSGSEIEQAYHEGEVVQQLAGASGENRRMMQEQVKVGQAAVPEGEFVNANDVVAPAKRELAGSAPQGTTRLGSLWNEKLLRKEIKKVSEAIDQLQSPSSRAELYERLEQKLNQARFEGAISPDDEFVDTDPNGSIISEDGFDDCGYEDNPRPSRRPGRGHQNTEQAGGNYAEITRPTRPTEDELIERPPTEGEGGGRKPHPSREEGERKPHPSRRPRRRRRTAAESSGQSFDGVQTSDSALYSEEDEEEQPLQEEQGIDLAQADEAETDEDSVDATQRADQDPNETHAEDRAWYNESASEEALEHEPGATDEGGHSGTKGVDNSYDEIRGTDQAGEREAVSEELPDHETLEHQDGALDEEFTEQEPQETEQAWDIGVQPDEQNYEESHEAYQVGEEEEAQGDRHSNQKVHEAYQITPNEARSGEQSSDESQKMHEPNQANQSEEEIDEQSIDEPSTGHGEAQTSRQSFRQTRQRKPVMPNQSNLQEENYSQTFGSGEPIRYAAETQGGVHRQTQRASARRHHEPESRGEAVGSNETQRRGPVRRQAGNDSEETARHIRRGHVRSNETQPLRQGPRQTQRTSQARRYENESPRQSSRQVQRGAHVAQGMPQEEEDKTKEVLSYALREAEKLEQMANKMKHLYDYVVEQERLTRTGSTVESSRSSPKPASREALEKMIEQDIDNLLDSFRTLLNYAKDVQHTEEVQERRWEAPSTFRASSTPQREENRMEVNDTESFTPRQVRPPSQRIERARSASSPDRSIPQGRGSTVVSRSSNASPRRRVPTSSSSHNARQSEDAVDLTYKILDNYGNSNITVRALQDVNNTLEADRDASISAESSTLEQEREKSIEGGQAQEGDLETQEDSATSDIDPLADVGEHLGSLTATPVRALSMVPDAAPDSSFAAIIDRAFSVAGMNVNKDFQERRRPGTQSVTEAGKKEVEESQKTAITAFDPYSERKESSSEPSAEGNTASSTLSKANATMASERLDEQPADAKIPKYAVDESLRNLGTAGSPALGNKATALQDADDNESSAVRDLAGVRKRTRFNQANTESSGEEESEQPVFAVTPFETSSSRPPPAGPPERWAGAYTIRLSPRVSGMTRSSDGSDYPNTPYRTYRSYANPFSSPYSTHSFHEDYGKRFSNSYYHDNPPRNTISWKEFVRRREEKKALEKRKQEEANEPKLGVIETEPPKELGIINVNTRRSNPRPATPSQAYRPYTPMRPSQTMGRPPLTGTNTTRVSFTPYSSIAAAQGVTVF
ncbi:hypothetical protein Emag_003510 [Eimeria magna]